jgi:histone deacetylase 6
MLKSVITLLRLRLTLKPLAVSAGFDAAKNDPLGECNVTPEGFAHMTHMLSSLANGKTVLALEVTSQSLLLPFLVPAV